MDTRAAEHPRLLFSGPDLSALRAKLEHPDCARVWGRLLGACERMLESEPAALYPRHIRASHMAFAWLITGREAFAEKARSMALAIADRPTWSSPGDIRLGWGAGLGTGMALCETSLAYDWLYPLWTEAERVRLRGAVRDKGLACCLDDVRRGARCTEWYTCNGMCVVNGPAVLAALAFEDDLDTREAFETALRQIRRAIAAHCPDGGYPEGPLYWNYGIRHMLLAVESLRRLKGIDLYDEPFLRATGDYALHVIHPWLTQCANVADSYSGTHLWAPIAALAARHRRPDWQWLARRLLAHDWGDDGESLEYSLMFLIHYDPGVPAAPPADEQRVHLFSGLQQMSLRSGWGDDAIHAVWLNGPSNCHHNHLHLNSLTVAAYGERLLIELGKYDYADNADSRKKTDGHNSLLVDGEGQVITTDTDIWCRRIRAGQWGTVYGIFECLRQEAGATIATGVTVNAYPGRLRRFDRTVAFVDNRFFLVHDFVELAKAPPAQLEWRWHAGGEIVADGRGYAFASGKVRLRFVFMEPGRYGLQTAVAPHELDRPGKPVPRLDQKVVCAEPVFNMFALLVPYREGGEPAAAIAAGADGNVEILFEGERWAYSPTKRKLRAT